jgi:hypothetical protein
MNAVSTARAPAPSTGRGERPRIVIVAATLGALILAFEAYAFSSWIGDGQASRTGAGPDSIPTSMVVTARVAEIGAWALALWVLNRFLVQPWRREGHLTSDGIFLCVCATLFWLDPLYQYSRSWSNYNAAFVNLGSWAQLPGAPNEHAHQFPEALIFGSALYVAMVFGGMATGNWFMRTLGRRYPAMKGRHLAIACFVFLYAIDIVLEGFVFVRLGCYVFPAANGPMINEGHYYQFPLTYATCVVLTWWVWSCLRYFKDDKGNTLAERGVERLGLSGRPERGVRFLAIAGVMHALGLLCFVLPMNLISLHEGKVPADFEHRSYLLGGLCYPNVECTPASN